MAYEYVHTKCMHYTPPNAALSHHLKTDQEKQLFHCPSTSPPSGQHEMINNLNEKIPNLRNSLQDHMRYIYAQKMRKKFFAIFQIVNEYQICRYYHYNIKETAGLVIFRDYEYGTLQRGLVIR